MATSTATPTSPTRTSRLRGLSYLRNYAHHREHPPLARAVTSPSPERTAPAPTSTEELERMNSASAHFHTTEGGWMPTVQGRSAMSRTRAATAVETTAHSQGSAPAVPPIPPTPALNEAPNGTNGTNGNAPETSNREPLPTIRFIPHVELRSSRPSLQFTAVSRTLKQADNIVRVGRYSERDNLTTPDTDVIPVGFKSKVVSRRHCEFWCTNGQWYVKDVKSSSGTFLNHLRLSAPGAESRPFPVNDGDVVQLGIDFKGGEELIFRCVKIRVECNRGWQKSLNNFNTSTHKRLLKKALRNGAADSDAASTHSSECSICLNPVSPCQALFVAPCSHVWHYKCIRNLLHGPNYPNFLCPNCRFNADLEADVEQPEPLDSSAEDSDNGDEVLSRKHTLDEGNFHHQDGDIEMTMESGFDDEGETQQEGHIHQTASSLPGSSSSRGQHRPNGETSLSTPSKPVAIIPQRGSSRATSPPRLVTTGAITDGPMTPRNDVGPFVLDGGAGFAAINTDSAANALRVITGDNNGVANDMI